MKKFKVISFLLVFTFIFSVSSYSATSTKFTKARETHNINMWINSGIEGDNITKLVKDNWNKNHDLQVTVTVVPGSADDYFQKLTVAFASDSGPDIFAMSPTEIIKYVDSGIAMDISKWILPNKNDYYENPLKAVTFNGKVYGTPANMDLLALYYNKDMFAKAGLKPPTTWKETIDAAKKLTTKDRYGMLIDTTESGYQNFEFYPFVWMNGGNILSPDGKKVVVDSATTKAFGFYRDLINSGAVCKKDPSETFDITLFGTGKVAMQICGSWAVSDLKNKYSNIKYGILPFPVPVKGMKSSSDAGGWKYMVSTKGKYSTECADFLDWLWNKDTKFPAQSCMAASKFSPRKSVTKAAGDYYKQAPLNQFVSQILPIAGMEPALPSGVVKAFGDALQEAMFTNKPLAQITEELKKNCQKAIE